MSKIFYIDLFAGGGGTTTGIEKSETNSKVVVCVNHDADALASHAANHPRCLHMVEDVRDANVPRRIEQIVKLLRKDNPNCLISLWASLECTNHTDAKGGLAKDEDSRTLGKALYMQYDENLSEQEGHDGYVKGDSYIQLINPDFIHIENVREFMRWGPLDDKGHPIKSRKGECYDAWVDDIKELGYNYDYDFLNSADFGGVTIRTRYFGMFAKKGLPISFPKPTHFNPEKPDKYEEGLIPWRHVREVLELDDHGQSIFTRPSVNKKQLVDKTLDKIFDGLIKIGLNGDDRFLIEYYGNARPHHLNKPNPTVPTKDRFSYLVMNYGESKSTSIDKPAWSVTKIPKHNLINTDWLTDTQFGRIGMELSKPSYTLIARMDKSPMYLVQVKEGVFKINPQIKMTPSMEKIIAFCLTYGIADISMRELRMIELKRIQGFDDDYILKGTKTKQKWQLGNAVEVFAAKALIRAQHKSIKNINYENLAYKRHA